MGRKVQSERRKAGVGGGGRGRLERPPLGALKALGRANLPGVLGPAKEPRDSQLSHGAAGVGATPNSATEPPSKARCHFRFVVRQALAIPRHAIPESQAHSRCSINAKGNGRVREPGDLEVCGSSAGGPRRPVKAYHGLAPGPPLSRVPRPARGPVAATAGPAGAARGLHWACSDSGQVAARASFRGARPRDLPGRPAPPDAAGMRDWVLRGEGRSAGCRDGGHAGLTPPPPGPGLGGHAGGLVGVLAAPGPRATSGIRGVQAGITWPGWGGAWAAKGWAFWTRRRGRGRALQSGRAGLGAEVSAAQQRGRTAAGIQLPVVREVQPLGANSPQIAKMAFPWPGTNSSAKPIRLVPRATGVASLITCGDPAALCGERERPGNPRPRLLLPKLITNLRVAFKKFMRS